jgi:putative sterol carrier protein
MSLEELTKIVQEKVTGGPSLGHTAMFDLGADGVIFWDGTQTPPVVDNESRDAEMTMKLSAELFEKMMDGGVNATVAYMTGKLKITGSMGVAMKINSLLGD